MEFYALTPRQLSLLFKRHAEELQHREMVSAFTTAAVINSGNYRPEKPATALDFMPNHRSNLRNRESSAPELTDEQLDAKAEYQQRVLEMSVKLKSEAEAIRNENG